MTTCRQGIIAFLKEDGETLRAWLTSEIAKAQKDATVLPLKVAK